MLIYTLTQRQTLTDDYNLPVDTLNNTLVVVSSSSKAGREYCALLLCGESQRDKAMSWEDFSSGMPDSQTYSF